MKIPVLKALANPARIFFVPYNLAVFNFMLLLFAYLIVFIAGISLWGESGAVNPLYFMLALIGMHSSLAFLSKKEPFLFRIVMARLALFRKKIPDKLFV